MKNILNKVINKSKTWLTFPYYQNLYLKNTLSRFIIEDNGKYAIVNFDSKLKLDDYSRYFYTICIYLENAGFKVIVKTTLGDIKASMKSRFDYQRFILKGDCIPVRNCSTPLNTIVLVQPNTTDHVIHISYGYDVTQNGHFDCIAPYPMYPTQYEYSPDASFLAELEKSTRNIKIFFSGSTKKHLYPSERVRKFFNIIPRLELIQYVLSQFDKCSRLLNKESEKLVLKELLESNDYANEIIISEVKTEEKDWLKILSKTDFFICPPGARMPWCHNCVEAMSVGIIPILEYGSLFSPALQHMNNCLSYSNYEELEMVIKQALSMDASKIKLMRKNVLQYYNDYLSIQSITNKIKAFSNLPKNELNIAIPFIPAWEQMHIILMTKN